MAGRHTRFNHVQVLDLNRLPQEWKLETLGSSTRVHYLMHIPCKDVCRTHWRWDESKQPSLEYYISCSARVIRSLVHTQS